MTLVSQIITDAYRESNLIPITQTPNSNEQAEGLRLFNRFVKSVYGNEAGDKFIPVPIGENNIITPDSLNTYTFKSNEYLPLNSRIIANLTGATTINVHPDPVDGSRLSVIDVSGNFGTYNLTLNGNGRLIEGSNTKVLNTNSIAREWFYKAEEGNWVLVSDLTTSDVFPFPEEFEDLFVIGLALRLNPRNGIMADDQTMLNFKRLRSQFRARYNQDIEVNSEAALYRLSGITRNYQLNPLDFDRG